MLVCGVSLFYKLGEQEKYEEYRDKILAKLEKSGMYASEFMDACKAVFDCGMDAGDYDLVRKITQKMDDYMQKYPKELKVGLRTEEFKYAYARARGDRDAMLSALEKKREYYSKIIAASEEQRTSSVRQQLRINENLQKALKNEARANRARMQFLANMSHDIRTPMNAIVGITELMGHALDEPEKLQGYLYKIQLSSRHMLGLVNDLLDMNKIESGTEKLNREPMNLAEQVEQIDHIIRPQAMERDQNFEIHLHRICHENLVGDAVRLRQALLNVLTNAVKYTPEGGSIRLDIEELECELPSRAQYCFTVTDNGMGMEQELLDHIFEPFIRGKDSVINKIQGTGLGMPITKGIVDMMGGLIRVESKIGEGSRIEITLGFKIDAEVRIKVEPVKILLFSGDRELAENLSVAAQMNDSSVVCASQMKEADILLSEEDIDIVLISGYAHNETLTERVAELRRAAGRPVLILGLDDRLWQNTEASFRKYGLDGQIFRPFFYTDLEREIYRIRSSRADETAGGSVLQGMRFLCAEDNELNAEILEAMLEVAGASCKIYRDGKELVEAFSQVKPGEYDAVLMDIQMPNMNGYEAARALRNGENPLGRTIPVIAMTANAFLEDVQKSMEAGMNAHLAKPMDLALLEKTMRELKGQEKMASGKDMSK